MKILPGLFLFFLCVFSPCKAQFNCLGGDIGVTGTHPLVMQNGGFVSLISDAKIGTGFSAHIDGEFNFSAHFAFIPSLGLEYWTIGNSLSDGTYRFVLPELIRFYPAHTDFENPKIRWYCQAGLYYALGIGSKAYYFLNQSNIGIASRNIYGLRFGTGLTFPLWDGFGTVGGDVQSNILFAPSSELDYPHGPIVKTKEGLYTILFSLGYRYPFDFRHFKFVSYTFNQGAK